MEALSKASEVEVLPVPRVMKPVEMLTSSAISNALKEGYHAMEEKRFSEARPFFKKAIELALRQPERAHFGQVFDAHMAWVVASVREGDEEEARVVLETLARLAPHYVVPKELPPVFHREFERAKLLTNRLPKGSISVESPEGAVVFLNGQPMGLAPMVVPNLPRGTHYISMEGSQFEMRFGQAVELRSASAQVRGVFNKATMRLPPGFVADPSLTPLLDVEALGRLEVLAKEVGAAFVVVGFIKELEPNYFNLSMALFHTQKKHFLPLAPVGFSKGLIGKAFLGKRVSEAILRRIHTADKGVPVELPLDWRAPPSEPEWDAP
jgi:hypothetical protein